MANLCGTCGTFVEGERTLWAEWYDKGPGRIAPICPSCGGRVEGGLRERSGTDQLVQYGVVNVDAITNNTGLGAVMNGKAALQALLHWKDDPAFVSWIKEPAHQMLYAAGQREFDALLQAVPAAERIVVRAYAEPGAPAVVVWLLPMRRDHAPAILRTLRYF